MSRGCEAHSASRRRFGFTLIELLVVVAVIALLISILLPALRGARDLAKRSACLSNERQIATAWQLYFNEYDDRFLQAMNANKNFGGGQGTHPIVVPPLGPNHPILKPLNPFLGLELVVPLDQAEAYRCPADDGVDVAQPRHFSYVGSSYTTNVILVGPGQISTIGWPFSIRLKLNKLNDQLEGLSLSRVTTQPATLMLLGDATWGYAWYEGATPETAWHERTAWHNLAYLDGHAAFARVYHRIFGGPEYQMIPFADLANKIAEQQPELPED